MMEQDSLRLQHTGEAELQLLFGRYHDDLLLVIWKIFPDWKIAEEILRDVFMRIKQKNQALPCNEEQLYTMLSQLCRKTTIENIPFLSDDSKF